MTNKQEVIELLNKEENKLIAKFFLQKVESMQAKDLDDLYFLLTTKDKDKINDFAKKKQEELQEKFSELERIGIKAHKMVMESREKKERASELVLAENLLTETSTKKEEKKKKKKNWFFFWR